MAEVRIPFCAAAELCSPFMLDETFSNPNGIKSVLLDKSKLQIAVKKETIEVPDIGSVEMCVFYIVGTIIYICNAFPVIQSEAGYDVQQQNALFNAREGNTAADCVPTTTSDALGWISAHGCVNVDEPIGGSCSLTDIPEIISVSVDNLAVANNRTSTLVPVCPLDTEEEEKRIVKWRGCFVITTGNS